MSLIYDFIGILNILYILFTLGKLTLEKLSRFTQGTVRGGRSTVADNPQNMVNSIQSGNKYSI